MLLTIIGTLLGIATDIEFIIWARQKVLKFKREKFFKMVKNVIWFPKKSKVEKDE